MTNRINNKTALTCGMLLCVLLCFPLNVLACTAGMWLEKSVDLYSVELSYNTYRIHPGQTVRFHFDLINVSNDSYGPGNPIPYDRVNAVFRQGSNTVYTQSVQRKDFSETAFDYTLPKKNEDYVLDVQYIKNGSEITATSFPIHVGYGNLLKAFFADNTASLMKGVQMRRE